MNCSGPFILNTASGNVPFLSVESAIFLLRRDNLRLRVSSEKKSQFPKFFVWRGVLEIGLLSAQIRIVSLVAIIRRVTHGGTAMGSRLAANASTQLGRYGYQPDMVVDSIADLCNPDKLLHDVLPSSNREDDTPHDIREWVAAHS